MLRSLLFARTSWRYSEIMWVTVRTKLSMRKLLKNLCYFLLCSLLLEFSEVFFFLCVCEYKCVCESVWVCVCLCQCVYVCLFISQTLSCVQTFYCTIEFQSKFECSYSFINTFHVICALRLEDLKIFSCTYQEFQVLNFVLFCPLFPPSAPPLFTSRYG